MSQFRTVHGCCLQSYKECLCMLVYRLSITVPSIWEEFSLSFLSAFFETWNRKYLLPAKVYGGFIVHLIPIIFDILGNILIWAMTNCDNYTSYELAIDLEDWSGNQRFARYRSFRLGDEADSFRMYHQNLFYGNAGDSLFSHNGLAFSTFDVDNDQRDGEFSERSCARLYKVNQSVAWKLAWVV